MSSDPTKKLKHGEKKQKVRELKAEVTRKIAIVDVEVDPEAKKVGTDGLTPLMDRIPAMEKSLHIAPYFALGEHRPHTEEINKFKEELVDRYEEYRTASQERKDKRDTAAAQRQAQANQGTYTPIREEEKSMVGHQDNCPSAPQGGSAPTYSLPNWGVATRIINNRELSSIREQAYPNPTSPKGGIAPNTHPGHYLSNRAASGMSPYQIQPNQSLSAPQDPIKNGYPGYEEPAQAVTSEDTVGKAGRVPIQNPAYARAIGQGGRTRDDIPGSHSTPRWVPSPTPSVALRRLSTPGPELTPLPPPPRNHYENRAATQMPVANAGGSSNANNSLQRSNTFGSVRYSTTSGSDQSMVNQARFSAQSEGSSTEWQRYSQASSYACHSGKYNGRYHEEESEEENQ